MEQQKPLDHETKSAIRNLALRRLSRSALTESQLRQYLARKNAEPALIDSVIQDFIRAKLINDEDYAEMFVRFRRQMKSTGPAVLRQDLRKRGLAEHVIESAVEARDGDDMELACSLAQRKAHSMRNLDSEVRFRRIYSFLVRRGYSSSVAIAATKSANADAVSDVEGDSGIL
jgi:regulatory protein